MIIDIQCTSSVKYKQDDGNKKVIKTCLANKYNTVQITSSEKSSALIKGTQLSYGSPSY